MMGNRGLNQNEATGDTAGSIQGPESNGPKGAVFVFFIVLVLLRRLVKWTARLVFVLLRKLVKWTALLIGMCLIGMLSTYLLYCLDTDDRGNPYYDLVRRYAVPSFILQEDLFAVIDESILDKIMQRYGNRSWPDKVQTEFPGKVIRIEPGNPVVPKRTYFMSEKVEIMIPGSKLKVNRGLLWVPYDVFYGLSREYPY